MDKSPAQAYELTNRLHPAVTQTLLTYLPFTENEALATSVYKFTPSALRSQAAEHRNRAREYWATNPTNYGQQSLEADGHARRFSAEAESLTHATTFLKEKVRPLLEDRPRFASPNGEALRDRVITIIDNEINRLVPPNPFGEQRDSVGIRVLRDTRQALVDATHNRQPKLKAQPPPVTRPTQIANNYPLSFYTPHEYVRPGGAPQMSQPGSDDWSTPPQNTTPLWVQELQAQQLAKREAAMRGGLENPDVISDVTPRSARRYGNQIALPIVDRAIFDAEQLFTHFDLGARNQAQAAQDMSRNTAVFQMATEQGQMAYAKEQAADDIANAWETGFRNNGELAFYEQVTPEQLDAMIQETIESATQTRAYQQLIANKSRTVGDG